MCDNNCAGCGCGNKENEELDVYIPTTDELNTKILYLSADLENLRKNISTRVNTSVDNFKISFFKEFLDIYDLLKLSVEHPDEEGLKLILEKFTKVISDNSISQVENTGLANPLFHDIIGVDETNISDKNNHISVVYKEGYCLNTPSNKQLLIIPSMVKTYKYVE